MTLRNLMAGYTAYTDADELSARRGTHRQAFVTTTVTWMSTLMAATAHDFAEPGTGARTLTLTPVREIR